jgi:hypothetical protein
VAAPESSRSRISRFEVFSLHRHIREWSLEEHAIVPIHVLFMHHAERLR